MPAQKKRMNQREFDRLGVLLKKFEKDTRLKEVGVFDNAKIMESIEIVKRVKKKRFKKR